MRFLFILFFLVSLPLFSQMTRVPGVQPDAGFNNEVTIQVGNKAMLLRGNSPNYEINFYDGTELKTLRWAYDTRMRYFANLGSKYLFFDEASGRKQIFIYDAQADSTSTVDIPVEIRCPMGLWRVLSETIDNKVYFACVSGAGYYNDVIVGFDGQNFEYINTTPDEFLVDIEPLEIPELNKTFVWYGKQGTENVNIHVFNGTEKQVLVTPQGWTVPTKLISFKDQVLWVYRQDINDQVYRYSFYVYKNGTMSHISDFDGNYHYNIKFMENGDKIYISLSSGWETGGSLYEYDGETLRTIFVDSYDFPRFLGRVNGTDIFSMAEHGEQPESLYKRSGNEFSQIPGSTSVPVIPVGVLKNKLFFGKLAQSSYQLVYYDGSADRVVTPAGRPRDMSSYLTPLVLDKAIIHRFGGGWEYDMYGISAEDEFLYLNPEGMIPAYYPYQYQFQGKAYVFFYDSDGKAFFYHWDGLLSTEGMEALSSDIVVYPNPVEESLYFSGSDVISVRLFSSTGAVVLEKTISSTSGLDVSGLAGGFYILEIKADGKVQRRKIIKK